MHERVETGSPREQQRSPLPSAMMSPSFSAGKDVLYRKLDCACGGVCPTCQDRSGDPGASPGNPVALLQRQVESMVATTLKVSEPDDAAEVEADRIADQVMRMPASAASGTAPGSRRDFTAAREFGSPFVHAKRASDHGSVQVDDDLGARIESNRGNGSALDSNAHGFFEPRFGARLDRVRVHADGEAASLNRFLSAKAFTVGDDIFFGDGQYRPDSEGGRRLLAHELAHVAQGGGAIRRCKNKDDEAKYDAKIAEIKALAEYTTLVDKTDADTIIKEAKDKPDCLYYAKKLKDALTTPVDVPATVATAIRKETDVAVAAETKRLETKEAKKTLDVEEAATADPEPEPPAARDPVTNDPVVKAPAPKKPGRNWTTYDTVFGGGKYKVDATDPLNIYAKVKVNLVPAGSGTWDDVKKIKSLEDAIEKHASRKGFTLNLEFVNPENKPDFVADAETVSVNANPRWPNATNWGSNARTCAHELFHILNYPLDRYNYIESHSKNRKMAVAERLGWFLEQMHKPEGFDIPESLMASGTQPIEEDVCTVARLDMATCLKAREKLAPIALDFRIRFSGGYANVLGASGEYLSGGVELGIPLRRRRDWMLYIGANATLLAQLDDDFRSAYLFGGRLALEKRWSPSTGGPLLGLFAGGGAALVSDKDPSFGATRQLGGYGEAGIVGGYDFGKDLNNLSIQVELGGGTTNTLQLHDPSTGRADPKKLQWIQSGVKATVSF